MGRPPSVGGGRPHVVPVRLSDDERKTLHRIKGGLTDSAYIRMLINREGNR